MKLKTFFSVAVIVLFTACSSTYRATDTGVVISPDATRAFELQYPNAANVVWTNYDPNIIILNDWDMTGWAVLDGDDYVVQFDIDNERHHAWYDSNGEWIGSAIVVNDYNTLPDMVKDAIRTKYPGYSISSVNKEVHKDRVAYEVVLRDGDTKQVALIDLNGLVVKSIIK
jgi:hypothetical protein